MIDRLDRPLGLRRRSFRAGQSDGLHDRLQLTGEDQTGDAADQKQQRQDDEQQQALAAQSFPTAIAAPAHIIVKNVCGHHHSLPLFSRLPATRILESQLCTVLISTRSNPVFFKPHQAVPTNCVDNAARQKLPSKYGRNTLDEFMFNTKKSL
jgi:hypothetical protein